MLVAVEFTGQRRKLTAAARLARNAAMRLRGLRPMSGEVQLPTDRSGAADLDFDASLAEFQELARSAGAEIAATLIQRRARPDAATLVGQGKLEEIEAWLLRPAPTGAVRPRSDAIATAKSGGEAALPGDRPDAADPGHLCAPCADAGRSAAGGAGAAGVSAASAGRARQGDVPAGRRHRYPRTGRDAAGDGPPQDQSAHRPCEGATGGGAADSPAAAAAARGGAGASGGAGGLYECGQEHAVQRADRGGRAGVFAHVCDARSEAAAAAAAVAGERSCCRIRWDLSAICRTRW